MAHGKVHSTEPRGPTSGLFAINHTLAMLRDGVGRLVRRSWCHAKLRRNLEWHLWVWTLYRNYVRELRVLDQARSSASMLGIAARRLCAGELLEWPDRLPQAAWRAAERAPSRGGLRFVGARGAWERRRNRPACPLSTTRRA